MTAAIEKLKDELAKLQDQIADGKFIPISTSGKQSTPNQIRAAIRKYLTDHAITQKTFLEMIRVNSNSYGKFMNAKYYKNEWSAVENGTYFAAAEFLAKNKIQQKIRALEAAQTEKENKKLQKINGTNGAVAITGKRPRDESNSDDIPKSKKASKADGESLLKTITAVEFPAESPIYEDCDQIRKMINAFLKESGVTKSALLKAIDANSNSFNRFLSTKGKHEGASNSVYVKCWRFFEQKRILENGSKCPRRLKNEKEWINGFPLDHNYGKGETIPFVWTIR